MDFFSAINVVCDECYFVVSDYIFVQTFTNKDDPPKQEFLCRHCANEKGLPIEYDGREIKTIAFYVGE